MKKIFTLIAAAAFFTTVHAQNGSRDNRQKDQPQVQNGYGKDVAANNNRYDKDNHGDYSKFAMERKRDLQIAQINREYDYKIQKVKSNFFLNRFAKQREIRFLEEQRNHEIKKVYEDYSRHDDHDSKNHH